jgi:hypothetical protein
MLPALEEYEKDRVWRMWLSGETRKNIAEICKVGAGSVTNIVNKQTKGLDSSEYGAIRDLAVQLKKEEMTFAELAAIHRRHNYINKLGSNEEEVEVLVANLLDKTRSIPIEKTADLVNQIFETSKSENIPPAEVPAYINRKIEEKARLDAEIQKSRAILNVKSVDVQNLNEYKKSNEQLKKYGFSMEAPQKLLSVLQSFNEQRKHTLSDRRCGASVRNVECWNRGRTGTEKYFLFVNRLIPLELGFLNWLCFVLQCLGLQKWKIYPIEMQPMS